MNHRNETFPENPNVTAPWACPKWLREAAQVVFCFVLPLLAFMALMIGFTIMRDADDRKARGAGTPMETGK